MRYQNNNEKKIQSWRIFDYLTLSERSLTCRVEADPTEHSAWEPTLHNSLGSVPDHDRREDDRCGN